MKTLIIIPARYGSTRFPGKPLTVIAGETMLSRVVKIARQAANKIENIMVVVATEDQRIVDHAEKDIGVECVLTSNDCATGSDRVLEALEKINSDAEIVIGLQGDAPFTPPEVLLQIIQKFKDEPTAQVVTPVVNLRWAELDQLRKQKEKVPFTGTTAILNPQGCALWFSKNILPAIRKENREREFSPVHQHIGLYGYRVATLRQFVSLPQGHYEQLEGLEQLRFLENDIPIHTVTLNIAAGLAQAGIDSPEDVIRAEKILARQ